MGQNWLVSALLVAFLLLTIFFATSNGLRCLHCIGPQCEKTGNRFFADCGINNPRDDEDWKHQCVTVFHKNYERDEVLFKGCSTDGLLADGCRYVKDAHKLLVYHPMLKGIPGATVCLCSMDFCNSKQTMRPNVQ